jgi:hypothetical protein
LQSSLRPFERSMESRTPLRLQSSHSSGRPEPSASTLMPAAMSQASRTPLPLQSDSVVVERARAIHLPGKSASSMVSMVAAVPPMLLGSMGPSAPMIQQRPRMALPEVSSGPG